MNRDREHYDAALLLLVLLSFVLSARAVWLATETLTLVTDIYERLHGLGLGG